VEYGRRGLRVNCVCPAGITTGITENIRYPAGHDPSLLARQMPLNGMAEPALVAGVIAMLASADGGHINGAEIKVDGGALA
jgi:NAD(P)-dependent dehydrogenase (short-subunit alcohol dehydrogenase family)